MHPCPDDELLAAFVAGKMSQPEATRVESHLRTCAGCTSLIGEFGRVYRSGTSGGSATPPQRAPAARLEPGATVGRYEVESCVGQGGMGVVYAAFDPKLRRRVALKLLHAAGAGEQKRLLREAQAMAQLSHRNVVAVHDVGNAGDRVFVAMELVPGQTLTRFLRDAKPQWRRVIELFAQAGRGLAAAHRAGLVHSDFKPDNVLVEDGGRVIVTDFGLARSVEPSAESNTDVDQVATEDTALDARLTQTGALVGTPAFMAPEVLGGRRADELSDQFSYCVALYTALYDQRPFDASSFSVLMAALDRGEVTAPPASTRVPARIRRVVVRGLCVDPTQRWQSMDALLRRLEAERSRSRRGLFVVGGVALAAAAAVGAGRLEEGSRRRACARGGGDLAKGWRGKGRGDVEAGVLGTGASYAAETWERIAPELDAYATSWSETWTRVCLEATVEGVRAETTWPTVQRCFAERRRAFAALTEVLGTADAGVARRAVMTVRSLPRIAACEDEAFIAARRQWPEQTETLDVVKAQRQLALADVLEGSGKHGQAVAHAVAGVAWAEALEHARLQAESAYHLGSIQTRVGAIEPAIANLQRAVERADAIGHGYLSFRALLALVHEEGQRGRTDRADVWAELAQMRANRDAALLDPGALADLAQARGNLAAERGDAKQSIALLEAGLAEYEASGGANVVQLGEFHVDLGGALFDADRWREAKEHTLKAVELYEDEFGPGHPAFAQLLGNLATVHGHLGEFEEADALFERALPVLKASLGDSSASVAGLLGNMATIAAAQHDNERALALYEQTLAVNRAVYGGENKTVTLGLLNVGTSNLDLRRFGAAREPLEQAYLLGKRVLEPGDPLLGRIVKELGGLAWYSGDVDEAISRLQESLPLLEAEPLGRAEAMSNLGVIMSKSGRGAEALPLFEEVVATYVEALPPGHPTITHARTTLAAAHKRLGAPAKALAIAEEMLASADDLHPSDRAHVEFTVAEALGALGRDNDRAVSLATRARDAFAAGGEADAGALQTVEKWLAEHR